MHIWILYPHTYLLKIIQEAIRRDVLFIQHLTQNMCYIPVYEPMKLYKYYLDQSKYKI